MSHTSNKLARMFASSALVSVSFAAVLSGCPLFAQMGSGAMGQGKLQQKLAAIKTSTAENQQKLHQYTWTETSRIHN